MCRSMLQKCDWIGEGFDFPTRGIEKPACSFENRGIIIQQVHSQVSLLSATMFNLPHSTSHPGS